MFLVKIAGKGTSLWCYRPYQNLKQIDFNFHSYVFDDVMCIAPICIPSYVCMHVDRIKKEKKIDAGKYITYIIMRNGGPCLKKSEF